VTTPLNLERLRFLAAVVTKECRHLETTDRRLFAEPFGSDRAARLADDADLAERVEAFVGRFGRLQDTLADKLLPTLLAALGERPGAQLDNLDRAERLAFIDSADRWLTIRQLRNRMVHEYIWDPTVLANALKSGHEFVGQLVGAAKAMTGEMERRGWLTVVDPPR
jgi:hypothetical protein